MLRRNIRSSRLSRNPKDKIPGKLFSIMSTIRPSILSLLRICTVLIIVISSSACELQQYIYPEEIDPAETVFPGTLPMQDVTFSAFVPESTPEDAEVYIDILDEVTGLAFNPKRYPMQKVAERFYTVTIPLSQYSVTKYRYLLSTEIPSLELTPLGTRIRYRLVHVIPGVQVRDLVSRWENDLSAPETAATGRVQGVILDASTSKPVGNILVSIAGISTITSIDGLYSLDGVPTGTHNLVAYSLDGSYKTFQQGALVAASSTTPATIQMAPAKLVEITFNVTPPAQSVDQQPPIRLIGNLIQLGNMFADLQGGLSTLAIRAPVLSAGNNGQYSIKLQLPAGTYLQYKYSIGDGFWNAEHAIDGSFQLREMIVPDKNTIVNDTVHSWEASGAKPIHFLIDVPDVTPQNEHISLQLNPYGWMEPIPVWQTGKNQWEFTLYSPMNLVGEVYYRVCRNEQCNTAVDASILGKDTVISSFTPSLIEQDIHISVEKWAFLQQSQEPTPVVTSAITKQKSGYVAGIELARFTHPSWYSTYTPAMQNIKNLSANLVIVTPTWSVTAITPPIISQTPGIDLMQPDTIAMIKDARAAGLQVAVYPRLNFPADVESWWAGGTRDQDWWQTWFDRYSTFMLNQATIAEQAGASALIIGGYDILPALPMGKLYDGSDSGVPLEAEPYWQTLISDIRSRFSGSIAWAVTYPYLFDRTPAFVEQMDWLYVLWSAPAAATSDPNQSEMASEILRLLNDDIQVMKSDLNKPVVLAVQFASANGAASNCITANDGCLQVDWDTISSYTDPVCQVDLLEQVALYNALFIAINQVEWLDGIVSRGFYPPAIVQDCSPSIYGKPAADVVWYWYPRMLGIK